MEDLYHLLIAHTTRWEPYDLHDLVHASWVGYVVYVNDTYSID